MFSTQKGPKQGALHLPNYTTILRDIFALFCPNPIYDSEQRYDWADRMMEARKEKSTGTGTGTGTGTMNNPESYVTYDPMRDVVDNRHTSIQIQKTISNKRAIHISVGDGTGYNLEVPEELFQEIRKAFNSDAQMVEVSSFTGHKCKETVK